MEREGLHLSQVRAVSGPRLGCSLIGVVLHLLILRREPREICKRALILWADAADGAVELLAEAIDRIGMSSSLTAPIGRSSKPAMATCRRGQLR
jgi:hypothetical protein